MGCNCGTKAATDAHSLNMDGERISIFCEDCDDLTGLNGMVYPVGKTIVRVTRKQHTAWVEQGHTFLVADEN